MLFIAPLNPLVLMHSFTLFRRSASDLGAKPATIAQPRPASSSRITPIGRGKVTETSLLGPGNFLHPSCP